MNFKDTARKGQMDIRAEDVLPPHSEEAERGVIGCLLMLLTPQTPPSVQPAKGRKGASETKPEPKATLEGTNWAEFDNFLIQLKPEMFYLLSNKHLVIELHKLRHTDPPHKFDVPLLYQWLRDKGRLDECGGMMYIMALVENAISVFMFPEHLRVLKEKWERRRAINAAHKLQTLAASEEFDSATMQAQLAELTQRFDQQRESPMLEIVTIPELKAYVPEPKTFLVGADMISLGELTVIAGLPGLGKSRLANTLAFAGAHGAGEWMGYVVRRQWRTLVLQSENSMRRLQSEVADLTESFSEWVRFSKPTALNFSSPEFRHIVRRYWETWPFDMLIIDPWSDVVRDEKFVDYQEALENVMASIPGGDKRPCVCIVAHLKKAVLGDKRMTGRQLMGQVSGSMRLMQKARTAFMLQPASDDMTDDRVIFDCGKSNNDQPLAMSCWHRCNGQFLPAKSFDFEEWMNPTEAARKSIAKEDLEALFQNGRRAKKAVLVEELKEKGFSQPTAYRALDLRGKYADYLEEREGLLGWKG